MSLFSFVKDAGEKLWDAVSGKNPATMGEKVKSHIDKLNLPGTENVNVQVDENGKAVVTGDGLTQEAKEKVLVAVGNISGIGEVVNNLNAAGGATAEKEESNYYTVKSGDTLSTIAKAQYGNANDYMKIFEANKPMLSHPDKIYPGQMLIIPKK